jgi:hypothetical protein
VAPLSATSTGYEIASEGPVIDWLVVMRRLDESQTLEAAVRSQAVSAVEVHRLAIF